jgi:ABC-2 type transport system permease protein
VIAVPRLCCRGALAGKDDVNVNPLSHVATAARGLMNNTSGTAGSVAWSLIATAAITLVFAPLTLHLYGKRG